MKILVIGSGGREHAIVWKLAQSSRVKQIFCSPGNGGIARQAACIPCDGRPQSFADLASRLEVDLTIVGPEQPLVDGLVDVFTERGLRIVGPSAAAARLEGSKVFAKQFMSRHKIPSARFTVCDRPEAARETVSSGEYQFPVVVKADGLAAGKGVIIAQDRRQAAEAIDMLMVKRKLGAAGERVIIEECLAGREASFLLFTDGKTILPMAASQDYKRAYDNDQGPNTGGMGTFSTPGLLDEQISNRVLSEIAQPTIEAIAREGAPFRGVLYIGLMLTTDGPKVLEYNVRFGDPETQSILKRLDSDLVDIFEAITDGALQSVRASWSDDSAVCVVAASGGYPGSYEQGKLISGIADAESVEGVTVFHAGTRVDNEGHYFTSGGRVLGVTARAATLSGARERVYKAIGKIYFEEIHYRKDIASNA